MRRNFRYGAAAALLGLIPVGIALYEFYLAPASAQGGVMISPRLWYALSTFVPALPSLLFSFQNHHWPEGFAFAFFLTLSNVLIYGLCGFLIALVIRKIVPENSASAPHPRASH